MALQSFHVPGRPLSSTSEKSASLKLLWSLWANIMLHKVGFGMNCHAQQQRWVMVRGRSLRTPSHPVSQMPLAERGLHNWNDISRKPVVLTFASDSLIWVKVPHRKVGMSTVGAGPSGSNDVLPSLKGHHFSRSGIAKDSLVWAQPKLCHSVMLYK